VVRDLPQLSELARCLLVNHACVSSALERPFPDCALDCDSCFRFSLVRAARHQCLVMHHRHVICTSYVRVAGHSCIPLLGCPHLPVSSAIHNINFMVSGSVVALSSGRRTTCEFFWAEKNWVTKFRVRVSVHVGFKNRFFYLAVDCCLLALLDVAPLVCHPDDWRPICQTVASILFYNPPTTPGQFCRRLETAAVLAVLSRQDLVMLWWLALAMRNMRY